MQTIPYPNNGGLAPDGNAPRIETGAVQFGNDWPGLFIRGDDSFRLLMSIRRLDHFLKDRLSNEAIEQLSGDDKIIAFEARMAYEHIQSIGNWIEEDVIVK